MGGEQDSEWPVIEAIVLRFDAPLMSFGSTVVDRHGFTDWFPGRSMVTGLLANALGYDHRDSADTQALQDRLHLAARCDRSGRKLVDFQTVDLGQPFLARGWTARNAPEGRAGSVSSGTHIRLRHYLADAVYTVVLTLDPAEQTPTLTDLGMALREPERPLFLGRKSCLPAAPIFLEISWGESLQSILAAYPMLPGPRVDSTPLRARWPWAPNNEGPVLHTTDTRDWANQIHVGRSAWRQGFLSPPPYMATGDLGEVGP